MDDLDAARAHADALGGRTIAGPMAVPGTLAIVADPQGAVFAVWSGTYDD